MTDFEELHRWSVEQELRDPPAAASMAALRAQLRRLANNLKLIPIPCPSDPQRMGMGIIATRPLLGYDPAFIDRRP